MPHDAKIIWPLYCASVRYRGFPRVFHETRPGIHIGGLWSSLRILRICYCNYWLATYLNFSQFWRAFVQDERPITCCGTFKVFTLFTFRYTVYCNCVGLSVSIVIVAAALVWNMRSRVQWCTLNKNRSIPSLRLNFLPRDMHRLDCTRYAHASFHATWLTSYTSFFVPMTVSFAFHSSPKSKSSCGHCLQYVMLELDAIR